VKAELIDSLIIAIEVLLPDMCSVCQSEYSVGREETPALRCKGCYQGFHQPCLEQMLGGQKSLPSLPGSVYLLCAACSPNYVLMTTTGGSKPAAGRRRLSPVHDLDDTPVAGTSTGSDSEAASTLTQPARLPPATVMSGLPFLWADTQVDGVARTSTVGAGVSSTSGGPSPPPLPPPTIRSGLPFLWAERANQSQQPAPTADCQAYLRGECSHGISGKVNGNCDRLHRRRCNKYMKWGNKQEKGCTQAVCGKIHPLLCPKSLDMKCLDQSCSYKLHTLKCLRQEPSDQNKRGPVGSLPHQAQSGGGGRPADGVGGIQPQRVNSAVSGRTWTGQAPCHNVPPLNQANTGARLGGSSDSLAQTG
jgi:hypothetical protein